MNAARHYDRQARKARRARRNLGRRISQAALGALGTMAGGLLAAIGGWIWDSGAIAAGSGLLGGLLCAAFAIAGVAVMIGGGLMIADAAMREIV